MKEGRQNNVEYRKQKRKLEDERSQMKGAAMV